MFFGGQGGFPFHNNGPNNANVDNNKFYDLLGGDSVIVDTRTMEYVKKI